MKFQLSAFVFIITFFLLLTPIAKAEFQTLEEFSHNKQWKKLLHIKSDNQSYITSEHFWLSKTRNSTALTELKATIAAFKQPLTNIEFVDQHPQCQFPARYQVIKKHIDLSQYGIFKDITCIKYQKWRKQLNIESLSLVFASGYMSNPASMYGHLFLKLNNVNSNNLLDSSINYGAIVPNAENPIIYILRGIFGGYDAGFSDKQFYRHHHNYTDIELRDLWEYKLNLSQFDVNLITNHIWELLGVKFDYYFIDENCAFHIAKLLELVLDEQLIADDSLWVMPSSVIKKLTKHDYHQSLVNDIKYIPSNESILHNYFEQLTQNQKYVSQVLIANQFDFSDHQYQQLIIKDKQIVIEVLLQYFGVLHAKDKDNQSLLQSKKKLLKQRFTLPLGKSLTHQNNKENIPPHLGMPPSKVSIGMSSSDRDYYNTIGFRMNYFDYLSFSSKNKFTNVEMLDLTFAIEDKALKVKKIDVIDITSLYTAPKIWQDDFSDAWAVTVGFQQINNSCLNCGVYFAQGHLGKSYVVNNSTLIYSLLGAKAFVGYKDKISLSAKLGFITTLNKKLKSKLEFSYRDNHSLADLSNTKLNLEVNYHFAPNWELRLKYEKQKSSLVGINLNYFWDF